MGQGLPIADIISIVPDMPYSYSQLGLCASIDAEAGAMLSYRKTNIATGSAIEWKSVASVIQSNSHCLM
jgi:hypothetical protein